MFVRLLVTSDLVESAQVILRREPWFVLFQPSIVRTDIDNLDMDFEDDMAYMAVVSWCGHAQGCGLIYGSKVLRG